MNILFQFESNFKINHCQELFVVVGIKGSHQNQVANVLLVESFANVPPK
jgi:hypothetical protein